jgi:hypothetical protein
MKRLQEFTFEKADGSIRTIKGYTDMKLAKKNDPLFLVPTGKGRKTAKRVTLVWCVETHTYKSFITKNLVSQRKVVENRPKSIRIQNKDNYRAISDRETMIKRNKSPYFVLSILNSLGERTYPQIVSALEYLADRTKMSQNPTRTTKRVLDAFRGEKMIRVSKEGKYKLTGLGKQFLIHNVG